MTDPGRYRVAEIDASGQVLSLEEKPRIPKSRYAVTRLYFYANQVLDIAAALTPSSRGELEITDVNNVYLYRSQLLMRLPGRGMAWLETGAHESLLAASNFIETIELRQGLKIACPGIADRSRLIDAEQLGHLASALDNSACSQYLRDLLTEAIVSEVPSFTTGVST